MVSTVDKKYKELKDYIKKLGKVVVGFSGGVDSTLVLKASIDAAGKESKIVEVN